SARLVIELASTDIDRPMVMVATAKVRGQPSGMPSWRVRNRSPVLWGGVAVIRRRRGHGQPFAAHDPSVAHDRDSSPDDGGGEDTRPSLRDRHLIAADGRALHEALVLDRIVV